MDNRKKRILAVSSSGGHWVQLMRLRPSWDHCEAIYLTTEKEYEKEVIRYNLEKNLKQPVFYLTVVASRWQKVKLIRQLLDILLVIIKTRPDYIISTGAAPGYFALRIGKFLGAKTIWVDSIANVEELSLSGQKIRNNADVCLSQWPDVADEAKDGKNNPIQFWGRVL